MTWRRRELPHRSALLLIAFVFLGTFVVTVLGVGFGWFGLEGLWLACLAGVFYGLALTLEPLHARWSRRPRGGKAGRRVRASHE